MGKLSINGGIPIATFEKKEGMSEVYKPSKWDRYLG
jgi:hypothetical protein